MGETEFRKLSGLIEQILLERGFYSEYTQLRKGAHFQKSGILLQLTHDPEIGQIAKLAFMELQKIPQEQRRELVLADYVPKENNFPYSIAACFVGVLAGLVGFVGHVNGNSTLNKEELERIVDMLKLPSYSSPLGDMQYKITGKFEEKRIKSRKGVWENIGGPVPKEAKKAKEYTHEGIDMIGIKFNKNGDTIKIGNAPIYSICDGKVVFANWKSGYGRCIEILSEDSIKIRYGHLGKISVHVGQTVGKGQKISKMSNSGLPPGGEGFGNHLHIETIDKNGNLINPMELINRPSLEQEISRILGQYVQPDSLNHGPSQSKERTPSRHPGYQAL